jgi:hypothetical protein
MQPVAKQLPVGVDIMPHEPICCAVGGVEERCEPRASLWDTTPPWKQIHFSIAEPHYYAYEYIGDATMAVLNARGDLDCDGVGAYFSMFMQVVTDGDSVGFGSGIILRVNELE